jgi:hypothetical protein
MVERPRPVKRTTVGILANMGRGSVASAVDPGEALIMMGSQQWDLYRA